MQDRWTTAERICLAGIILSAIAFFLPWFHIDSAINRITVNGFRAGWLGDLDFITGAIMLFLILGQHEIVNFYKENIDYAQVYFSLGAFALGAVILQLIIGSNGSHSASWGMLLALIGASIMCYGGRRQRQADYLSQDWQ